MKKIRIGCGAGCSYDRIEPAEELIKYGNLNYIVFECLAERTMADNMQSKSKNSKLGYTPMLRERMERLLKISLDKNVKIITNMGGGNIDEAVKTIIDVAKTQKIEGLKIGIVEGDDIINQIDKYSKFNLNGSEESVESINDNIISANIYLGADGIIKALKDGANLVITGRIADASLFVGPLQYEFGWTIKDENKLGQAALLGHLLECAGQLTGGYSCDPGYKNIPDLHILGFPIAEIDEFGRFFIEKVKGSGGEVSERICKEQLIYEIENPSNYILPDAIVDFSNVSFKEVEENKVEAMGCKVVGYPDKLKVCIGYHYGYLGIGEISFGGENSLDKANLCENIIRKRLEIIGANYNDIQFDYIGFNSLFKNSIIKELHTSKPYEIRLRMAIRGKDFNQVCLAVREFSFMYTNGPAGSSGSSSTVKDLVGITSFLIPREEVKIKNTIVEV